MSDEFDYVIDMMRKIHDNWDQDLKVLHAEEGVMYTVRIGNQAYKAIKDNCPIGWKIIEMK